MLFMAPRSNVRPSKYAEAMTTKDDVPMLQLEVLKKIQAELVNLKHEVTGVKTELTSVKTELKSEISSVRAELSAEISNVRAELSAEISSVRTELSAEISSVRTELSAEISSVRTELKGEIGELRRETHHGFVRVRTELVGLRDDMEVGFAAMRIQNDRRFLDHERRLRELEGDV